MSYITTYTGKHIDPLKPEENLIDIRDIAHALSLICRGNGHVKHFFSVAQHCLACEKEAEARGASIRIRKSLLLHDAAEAYLCDLPSPVKDEMPEYRRIEDRLLDLIWKHFLGEVPSQEEQTVIWEIDKDLMSMDFFNLMPEVINDRYKKVKTIVDPSFRDPADVENEYLERFKKLCED